MEDRAGPWRRPLLVFDKHLHSRGVPLSFTPLFRLKRCRAYDQWHSSLVFTPLTGWHCKFRQSTEGTSSQCGRVLLLLWQRHHAKEGLQGVVMGTHCHLQRRPHTWRGDVLDEKCARRQSDW
jgi:hypothetical protein